MTLPSFISTLPGDVSAGVQCSNVEMNTTLNIEHNTSVDLNSIHVENSSCLPQFIDKTRVLIRMPLVGCGTKFRISQDGKDVIYYNYIHLKVKAPSSNPIIVRDHVVMLLIECRFKRSAVLSVVTHSPRLVFIFPRKGKELTRTLKKTYHPQYIDTAHEHQNITEWTHPQCTTRTTTLHKHEH